jgi:hypothetical protein
VFRVHPETKVSTGVLQQFVVTADYAGGSGTRADQPGHRPHRRDCRTSIPTTAPRRRSLRRHGLDQLRHLHAYHKGRLRLRDGRPGDAKGVDFAAREVFDGISMRIVRQYDINNDKFPCRLDVLYGYKTAPPQLACRLANN